MVLMNRLSTLRLVPLLLALAFPFRLTAQDSLKLPDIGTSATAIVSEQDERRYGEALVRELHRVAQVIDDPLVDGYIKHLGYRLAAFSDEPQRQFTFLVLDADTVNAFAAPGGVIAIHSALLLLAESESELAGVVAHEIAHVTQRHLARAIENSQRVTVPMMLLMLGAAIAAGGDGDAIQAAVVGGQGLMQQMMINFTRNNEYEADRVGIRTLASAGYDPEGMAGFFGRMARVSRNYGGEGIPEFLRTHPVETTRIAEAKGRARQVVVSDNPDHDHGYFELIRERVRVLTADAPEKLPAYYRERLDKEPDSAALRYGLALAHLSARNPIAAADALNLSQADATASLPVQLALADMESQAGKKAEASQRYLRLMEQHPGNLAVARAYAEELLMRGNNDSAAEAKALLKPLLARFPENAGLYLQYSRAADQTGDWVRAEESFAQYTFLLGQVYDSVTQLETLLKKPELNYYERARIEARLNEIRPILAEIQREDGYDPSEGSKEGRRGLSLF